MFLLYNFLLTFLSPFWVPWMAFRSWRRKEAVNWKERTGDFEIPLRGDNRRIWVHAVSVGEVLAALPILRATRAKLPNHQIVLSVTTSSGHQTAREKAVGLFDYLVYFPIDVPRFQLRAMQRVRPDVVAIMETELWMNFLWAAKTFDARTLLINGRISDRSFRRSKHLSFFYRVLLKDVDRCLMQSSTDEERIRALGAGNTTVLGNCKFDQAQDGLDADPAFWREELKLEEGRPVVVVGSIRAEEFEFLAQAMGRLSEPYWVVAPRHLEKAPDLIKTITANLPGGPEKLGAVACRSAGTHGDVIILDSYGELASVYAVADVVIVGGGFANLGGQNILQPLAMGKPVIFGPHMQNFRDVAAMAVAAGAALICPDPRRLSEEIERLLMDEPARRKMGDAARELAANNLGASERYASAIADQISSV